VEVWGAWKGKMEVNIMEPYYSVRSCVCEYEKGIVCGTFTINAVFKCYTESSAVFAELRLSKKLLYRKYDMDK